MSTVGVISTQYSRNSRNFSFKSKTETHLSLKISYQGEPDQKIKFTAVQLSKMNFNQQMLEVPRLPELVQKLFNFKFIPLLPLEKNPLKETHPLGFSQWIREDDPYRQDNPAWCEAVSGSPRIIDAPDYAQQIAYYKTKMGLPDVEEQLSPLEEEYLEKIDAAIEKLLGKEHPHEVVLEAAMGTIYESIYQLIVMPIKDELSYMQTPINFFMMNQGEFRSELQKRLPVPQDPLSLEILEKILDAMRDHSLEKTEAALTLQYSDYAEMIQELIQTAKALIQQALTKDNAQVNQYWQSPDMQFSFWAIFKRCEHLWEKYQMMLNGRYTSLKEIPRGLNDGNIHVLSYSSPLCKLLRACEAFLSSNEPSRKEAFNTNCREFFAYRKGAAHFQNSIQPLIKLLQPIRNILAWPGLYELSDGEQKYMSMNLYFLMFISNTQMRGKPLIPYDLLSISDEDLKIAENHLKNRKSSVEQKRSACRTLFHGRIPWKALQAIGSLMHRSGGVPEKVAQMNQEMVGAALTDLVPELSIAAQAIQDLLEFEAMEFSPNPSTVAPEKLPGGCYAAIHLLGSFSEIERNMKKAQEVLSLWRNQPFTQDDFRSKKIRFAILRTIQMIGEISKNLERMGFLNNDSIWSVIERLRDLLAHSEKSSVSRRLDPLINGAETKIFSDILEDFRTLLEHYEERSATFTRAKTWADRKGMQGQRKGYTTDLELKGLQDLYIYLTAKISNELRGELERTVEAESAENVRREISVIKEALLQGAFKRESYEADIDKLPLTKNQKSELKKNVKVTISENAANNSARQYKLSIIKTLKNICQEFKKSKALQVSDEQIRQLDALLNECEKPDDLEHFNEKIGLVQQLLGQLRTLWRTKQIQPPPQLEGVKFDELYETVDDFIIRKKADIISILGHVMTYSNLSEAKDRMDSLVRSIQLKPIGKEEFMLHVLALGVTQDASVWGRAYSACTTKEKPVNNNTETQPNNLVEHTKKTALRSIRVIIDRLQKLDELLRGNSGPQGHELFQKDRFIQLACQYLVSDFRTKASTLDECLEFIKYTVPLDPQFLQSIQDSLQSSISVGNEILHVHEVTQQSTLTDYGRRMVLFQHIQSLLLNWNGGKEKNVLIESLHRKIVQLEQIIEKIETV